MANASGGNTDSKKIEAYISKAKHGRGFITLENLQTILGTREQGRIYAAISPLFDAGAIEPLKSAKSNGSTTTPLFEKYRIIPPAMPDHDLTKLNPLLVSTGYLEHRPESCHKWWTELLMLSSWLSAGSHERNMTLRERCWEVFGNEKIADVKGFSQCVRHSCGEELRNLLMVRDDFPEDLPYVTRPGAANPAHIVVSENRDPYLAVRQGLLLGKTSLFGVPIDSIVYGRGNVVRQNGGASLDFTLESMRASKEATVLYWGDIDREGLTILSSLYSAGKAQPFTQAYEAMLAATKLHPPRTSPDGRDIAMPSIDGLFEHGIESRLYEIADAGGLLPQEAVYSRAVWEAMT